MIPGTTSLSPEGIIYIDETRNAIAISEVGHALSVDLDVRQVCSLVIRII